MAAIENHLEIVEFFFQYVKEYDKTDFHLISALKGCIKKKQRNIINYLLYTLTSKTVEKFEPSTLFAGVPATAV